MKEVRISPAASTELDEIWNYLAEQASAKIARSVITNLYECFELLAVFPHMGIRSPRDAQFRGFLSGQYRIVYRVVDTGVQIVRVVHCKMEGDW